MTGPVGAGVAVGVALGVDVGVDDVEVVRMRLRSRLMSLTGNSVSE
jgi:hypothetical protein